MHPALNEQMQADHQRMLLRRTGTRPRPDRPRRARPAVAFPPMVARVWRTTAAH